MRYTETEIRAATGGPLWLEEVLRRAGWKTGRENAWTAEELAVAASASGVPLSMDKLLRHLEAAHTPPAANDDDTLTVGELRAYRKRADIRRTAGIVSTSADEIMADITAHREPPYPEGTVVRDADRVLWQKTRSAGWLAFGVIEPYPDDAPVRPLEVIP